MTTKRQTQKSLRIGPFGVVPMWMMLLGPALLALAAVLLLSTQQPAEASDALSDYDKTVLADNPVAYFRLDGTNVIDLSPRNHDGRYVGAIKTTRLPNGEAATLFDGSSQYAEVPDANDLSIPATGKLTLEAWMRPDVLLFPKQEGSGYVHWMGKGEGGQQEYASRMYSLTNSEDRPNRISGYAFNLSGGEGIGSHFQDPVAAGEWIHYVFVVNTTVSDQYPQGYTKIYKNGNERDQDSLKNKDGLHIVPLPGTAPFRIGTRDLRSFFKGAIGKVAIYGHELRSSDVLEHYQKMVRPCTITGNNADNELNGTPAADVICGLGGNDTVRGLDGNDEIRGGPGNDTLYGSAGNDRVFGEDGNDVRVHTQDGVQGNDLASGGAGTDTCVTDPQDEKASCP